MLDVSVILPVRDAERSVAAMVRGSADLVRTMGGVGDLPDPVGFEVLTVDQRSGDNTLAVVSLLHGQVPELRTLQDVEPGTAIARAAGVAQGRRWLVLDRCVEPELVRWALTQVVCGHRAALVPGEVLAIDREPGLTALGALRGGLVSAQQMVERTLARRGERYATAPAPDRGVLGRTVLRLRGALGSLGLASLDRPPKGS